MKKYLIKGLLALVVGGFTASCADKDGDYVPVGQQKATAYADAFKELIGGEVAPNHDWGFKKTSIIEDFSQTRAMSRAITRGDSDCGTCWKYDQKYDTPSFPKTGNPAPITDSERAFVKNWFETNPGLSKVGLDIQNFYLQHVWGQANKNYNIKNEETGATEVNQGTMDYCEVGDGTNFTHVLDFNANSGGTWGIVYMRNSSALSFGFHATWGDDRNYHNFKLAHIVGTAEDGTKIDGYYVGLAMWGQKWDNGTKTLNYDQWEYADDWILKIVPGEGETSNTTTTTRTDRIERRRLVSQGRVFCEDLGTDAARMLTSDIDFNDAVFDAKIWRLGQFNVQYLNDTYDSESEYLEGIYTNGINQTTGIDYNVETEDVIVNGKFKYVAEICILAAGGTVPLKIGGNNGFEIHSKFGEGNNKTIGHTTIINTMGTPSESQFKALVNSDICNAVTTEVDITDLVKAALLKLKNDTEISLDIIPIEVMWTSDNHQSVGVLKAETEEDIYNAPQKLCVPIGTPWVYERIPITSAYSDFADYAKSRTPLFWEESEESTNRNPSLLYASGPAGLSEETNETGNVGTNPFHDEIVVQGETITTTEVETEVWTNAGLALSNYGNNPISNKTIFANITTNHTIRIYGYKTNPNEWSGFQMFTGNWKKLKEDYSASYSEDNFVSGGYVEYSNISADLVSALQHDTEGGSCILQGHNFTVTKITIVLTNTQRQ